MWLIWTKLIKLPMYLSWTMLIRSTYLLSLQKKLKGTYQIWLIWRKLIKLPSRTKMTRPSTCQVYRKQWYELTKCDWVEKILLTINEVIIKKSDLTNFPNTFTENNDTNLSNVTDLKKVDQTTRVCSINNADSTNIPSKFTENNDKN